MRTRSGGVADQCAPPDSRDGTENLKRQALIQAMQRRWTEFKK
jgi:hypothetical protein